jgi:hypothetical protein
MRTLPHRQVPLVLLGVTDRAALEPTATVLRREGMALAIAVGDRACLRVAAAVDPDIILLDPRLPRALLSLLRAHPLSKHADISWSSALKGTGVDAAPTSRVKTAKY